MAPVISAIICTHQRAEILGEAIQSLVQQTLNPAQYEMIIVDNASQDTTRAVVQEFQRVHSIRYIYEPKLGLSCARNTGWSQALGKYIAYLDDDAVAEPGWLAQILAVFTQVLPEPGCVGGKVIPRWMAPRPTWISDAMLPHLTILDWSPEPCFLNPNQWIVGANMAFPKHVLQAIAGFPESLGRQGNRLLSLEEIWVQTKIQELGLGTYYHPKMVVHHQIPENRLQKSWFERRFFWAGVSNAIFELSQNPRAWPLRWMRGIYLLLRHLLSPWYAYCLWIPSACARKFQARCTCLAMFGYALKYLGWIR